MVNNELISIVVPVYNVEKYIEKCVNSITNQVYNNLEIILVNDGSTDNTREVVSKMVGNENLSINYYYQKNMGKMTAINHLTRIATGEYMMDLDSDDMLSENAIEIIKGNVFEVPLTYRICIFKSISRPGR